MKSLFVLTIAIAFYIKPLAAQDLEVSYVNDYGACSATGDWVSNYRDWQRESNGFVLFSTDGYHDADSVTFELSMEDTSLVQITTGPMKNWLDVVTTLRGPLNGHYTFALHGKQRTAKYYGVAVPKVAPLVEHSELVVYENPYNTRCFITERYLTTLARNSVSEDSTITPPTVFIDLMGNTVKPADTYKPLGKGKALVP